VAQSTVRLIVDAQNAIRPLQRVNEQTKALNNSTNKLKGRLDRSNRSLRDTGRAAKNASAGVSTLTKAFAPLLAAVSVLGAARFVFVKTAELETQRKSLEVLTGSIEKTNNIIQELQEFGAVTPFTSSELIEQTKRLKAFGFETEELVDTTKRLSEVAGATGADLTGIATAFGQIRAKGKLQQEENLQLLERGVDITTELKRITGLQGDAFEKAQRQGKIGADLVNQALINLTNEGGAFFGGATAQADTLNGLLSTLEDSVDTLARTIGTELEEEIKDVLNFSIETVKTVDKLIKNIGVFKKAIDIINPVQQFKSVKKQLENQLNKQNKITQTFIGRPTIQNKIIKKNQDIITNLDDKLTLSDAINESFDLQVGLIEEGNFKLDLQNEKAEILKQKYMEIGQSVEQGIVQNLTDAVMGTQTLAQAAINVLDNLKRKLIEVQIQRAVSGIGNSVGGFLGGIFGGRQRKSPPLVTSTALGGAGSKFLASGLSSIFRRANGGPVSAGRSYVVGERGPELFTPRSSGMVTANKNIGGTTNMVTVNVDATGSSVSGNNADAQALGAVIGAAVQAQLVKEKRAGGLLTR
tara:strand:+ start:162 stop:1910 length:1749 start_codon:yes stop_codon:yes gene_type:complete